MVRGHELTEAKRNKKDEFYTQLTDIEKEMRHYRNHFKGKTVFCNCDDPFESNFFKYFVLNFNKLKLKKLIATCYCSSTVAGTKLKYTVNSNGQLSFSFTDEELDTEPLESEKKPYKAIVNAVHDTNGDGGIDMLDVVELFRNGENQLVELNGDGDFRSDECIELLKESDIVVTNPPFSLFREYVAQLMQYEKKFIIIGHQNALTYKEIFPLIKKGLIWLGNGFKGNVGFFESPYEDKASSSHHIDGMIRVSGVMWYTNLDLKKRHEELILVKRYRPELYKKYDNYDAINVDRTADIPYDYAGVMGVPITFLDKYSPEQFEIVGLVNGKDDLVDIDTTKDYSLWHENKIGYGLTGASGKKINGNPVLQGKPLKGCYFTNDINDLTVYSTYARIFIRNRNPEIPEGD